MREDIARLEGTVDTLSKLVLAKLDGVQEGVDKAAGVRSAITYAAIVIVPILVAVIGGYFALKAGVGPGK